MGSIAANCFLVCCGLDNSADGKGRIKPTTCDVVATDFQDNLLGRMHVKGPSNYILENCSH